MDLEALLARLKRVAERLSDACQRAHDVQEMPVYPQEVLERLETISDGFERTEGRSDKAE